MPIIPKYSSQSDLMAIGNRRPNQVGNFDNSDVGAGYRALGRAGESISNAGDVFARIQEARDRQKKQDTINTIADEEQKVRHEASELRRASLSYQGKEALDIVPMAEIVRNKKMEEISNKYKDNPELAKIINGKIESIYDSELNVLATHQVSQRNAYDKDINSNLVNSIQTSVYDFNSAKQGIEGYFETIKAKVANGYSPAQAEQDLRNGSNLIMKSAIEAQLRSNDPDVINQVAKDIKEGRYDDYLNEESKIKYHDKSQDIYKARLKDIADEAVVTAKQEKEAHKKALSEFKDNLEYQIYPNDGGMPTASIADIERNKELYERAGKLDKFHSDREEILRVKEAYVNGDKGSFKKSDEVYATAIYNDIVDGKYPEDYKFHAELGKLSRADAEKFNNLNKRITKDPDYAYNLKYAREVITDDIDDPYEEWQALDRFDSWRQKNPNQDINVFINAITAPHKNNKAKKILNIFGTSIPIPFTGDTTDKTTFEKVKEFTEQPSEPYAIGSTQTDAEGRQAEYLGKGKWKLLKK